MQPLWRRSGATEAIHIVLRGEQKPRSLPPNLNAESNYSPGLKLMYEPTCKYSFQALDKAGDYLGKRGPPRLQRTASSGKFSYIRKPKP